MRGSEGGGGVSRPDGQKTVWTTFFSPKLFYSFQMGSNIFQDGGGGGREQLLPGAGPNAFYRNPYNL